MNDKATDFTGAIWMFTDWTKAMGELWETMSGFTFAGPRQGMTGKHVDEFGVDSLSENLPRIWGEFYETELQKFYRIPQLGLTRNYQEKTCESLDKFNILQSTLAEFLQVLSVPFARSGIMMQEKLRKMAETGDLPEDPQSYYRIWIKVLEGLYMTLYQTPEYTRILARTVSALSEFKYARDDILEEMLSPLPIPKRKEIDDLEQEVHELKMELRELKRNLMPPDENTPVAPKGGKP